MDLTSLLMPGPFENSLFASAPEIERTKTTDGTAILVGEFWTHRQRQANPLHELAYRACFKGQLPNYFIEKFTEPFETVYDPFSGRGTTCLQAGIQGRHIIANDVNPISKILLEGRIAVPDLEEIRERLKGVQIGTANEPELDLSMFYHHETLREICAWKEYFLVRDSDGELDDVDKWLRAVATNRLTGHSPGYFSVYTLPPNQAVSPERQLRINGKRGQAPEYRDTKALMLRKSVSLQKGLTPEIRRNLHSIRTQFITGDARNTASIPDESVKLTVTSPPFLDVVQYASDNWLRCWFNGIDVDDVANKITMAKKLHDWEEIMSGVFAELFRVTRLNGYVAFEVGEVRNGSIRLEDSVLPIGLKAGFKAVGIMINRQSFTKTANIWGVRNNTKGTNTNRIVVFCKE